MVNQITNRFSIGLSRYRSTLSGFSLFFLYLLLSIGMTWPIAAKLGTHIPTGGGNDVFIHFWTLDWLKKCLLGGMNPFSTTMIFYPDGVSLTTHNIAWAHFLVWFPLQIVFDSYSAFSIMYIIIFALNCMGGYLLAKEWTRSTLAAFVGGLVFGFWPGAISRSGQPNLSFLIWIPLAMLFLGRTLEFSRKKDAILAGLCLALIGWVRWQVLIMASIAIVFYVIFFLIHKKIKITKERFITVIVAGLVALLVIAPIGGPVIADQLSGGFSEELYRDESSGGQIDLVSLFLPNARLLLMGRLTSRLPHSLQIDTERIDFLGYLSILISLYAILRNRRLGAFWLFIALVYIVLSFGPVLKVAGISYEQFPMPYRWVEDFFLIRILRKPHRFQVMLGLSMSMLVALGVSEIFKIGKLKRPFIATGIIAILILVEYCQVPYNNRPVQAPDWFYELKDQPEDFALFDFPMVNESFNKENMFFQTIHAKPIVEGHVSRPRPETFDFLNSTPFSF